jgi:hypothetical protein
LTTVQETGVSPANKEDVPHVFIREYIRYLQTVDSKKTNLLVFISVSLS